MNTCVHYGKWLW